MGKINLKLPSKLTVIILSLLFFPLTLTLFNNNANAQTIVPTDAAISPTFTSIGDCTANANCPTSTEQPTDMQPTEAMQPTDPPVAADQPATDTGTDTTQSGNQDVSSQIQQLIDKIKQLLSGSGCSDSSNGTPTGDTTTMPAAGNTTDTGDTSVATNSFTSNGLVGRFTANWGGWGRGGGWHKWGHGKKWGMWNRWKCAGQGGSSQQTGQTGGDTSTSPAPSVDQTQPSIDQTQPSSAPVQPSVAQTQPSAPAAPSSGAAAPTAAAGGSGDVSSTAWVAPSKDACPAGYAMTNSISSNFGDPVCNFTKDALLALLQQLDPTNADAWFNTVVPCESSYDPNAWAAPVGAQAQLDAGGAWGLFQMGSSTPPGQAPPAPGKNNVNDRGDVNWQVQAVNSTTTLANEGWGYWACRP